MPRPRPLTDAQLLAGSLRDPELFGEFYERHLPVVSRYLLAQTRNSETAADLVAEVFAAALAARERYEARHTTAVPWLLTIAKRKFIDSVRAGEVEAHARRSLGVHALRVEDHDLDRVEELADQALDHPAIEAALRDLDDETRALLLDRIVHERSYKELATNLACSSQVIRKRVSRGLTRVRAALEAQ